MMICVAAVLALATVWGAESATQVRLCHHRHRAGGVTVTIAIIIDVVGSIVAGLGIVPRPTRHCLPPPVIIFDVDTAPCQLACHHVNAGGGGGGEIYEKNKKKPPKGGGGGGRE